MAKTKRKNMAMGGLATKDLLKIGLNTAGAVMNTNTDHNLRLSDLSYNSRVDPRKAMTKEMRRGTTGEVLSGIGSGAAAGSVGGLPGMAVGAGLGLITGGAKALIGKKKKKAAIDEATTQFKDRSASNHLAATQASSYKEGGEVIGPGGPKEDKVKMDVAEGSFIVPSENADKAMEIGKRFLGWDGDEKVGKKTGSSKINASSGEVIFTPEEVEELDFYGVDLNSLAPNAEEGPRENYRDAGYVEELDNPVTGRRDDSTDEEKSVERKRKWQKYLPEAFGTIQASAGLYGLATAKKVPDPKISNELRLLASETKKLREQGLDPASRNQALKSIEQNRRSGINEITSRGGTASDIASGMTAVTSAAMEGHERIALADEEIRRSNRQPYFESLKMLSSRKDEINREKREIKERKDDMFAGLLHAGISNIVGARQFKEHLDFLKANKSQITLTTNPE